MTKIIEAIILVGGLGTRLKSVVATVPKPLALIAGVPFLDWIFKNLAQKGIKKVILATGYGSEAIEQRYKSPHLGMEIIISREMEPLGTGGAIKLACAHVTGPSVFIFNGDTYAAWSPDELVDVHVATACPITIVLKHMHAPDRYGTVSVKGNFVTQFNEKRPVTEGLINSGIYLLKCGEIIWPAFNKFSFERELLEPGCAGGLVSGLVQDGPFIDIGVPESFEQAQTLIPRWLEL